MIRVLRSMFPLMLAATVLQAQAGGRPPVPPPPPTPPAPPAPPAPPLPLRLRDLDLDFERLRIPLRDLEHMRLIDADEIRRVSLEASRAAREVSREAMEASREASRRAMEESRQAFDKMRLDMNFDMHLGSPMWNARDQALLQQTPFCLDAAAQARLRDPADSLYLRARALLTDGDQRVAAMRFKELQQKYPSSRCIAEAMYWQAFAQYRIGTDAELRDALTVLDAHRTRFPTNRFANEVATLSQRIRGELGRRGDRTAAAQVAQAANSGSTCDREEQSVQIEALSALERINPEAATLNLDKLLARRDECSLQLRQAALRILGRRGDERSISTLISTAKQDPSTQLRGYALDYLARFTTDEVLATYESIARTEQNEAVRRAAARNLVGFPAPRARQIARTLVEDNAIPENVRVEMIDRYNSERGTNDDAVWLRAAYPKVTSDRVKRAIVGAVARIGGADSQKWLMDLATNDQESSSIRTAAYQRVATTMSVADLAKTYDAAGSRRIRSSIVQSLAQRKEPEATDKLIDIARRGTDPELRREVISILAAKKDPKITAMLLELIDR